jgi:protein-S-isoprenylcysteine O-methyltransferase Ste14
LASLSFPLVVRCASGESLSWGVALAPQFGGEYDAYCARTSRLIPGLY